MWQSGRCCEETCPAPCMCLESFLCLGPGVSASRMYVMDQHQLGSDPCDRRFIRFSNCMQVPP
jgi:hypothetical protein